MAKPATQQSGEAWTTQNVLVEGGLYLDKDTMFQATQMPGSARTLINFEPSLDGGYHRILGYSLYDTNQLPHGATQVFGAIVNFIDSSIIAMQGGDTYRSTGSGWTKINSTDNHTGMGKVSWTFYTWATSRFAWCDGDPNAYPIRIEASGAYTILNNAPKGQKYIQEFGGYLWMTAGDGNLTFSAPNNDNDYNAIDGAGEINVGFPIVGLGVWRGALYVLGQNKIAQITGTSAADWTVTPLTDNIGMSAPYTLQEVNGDLIFLSEDGLRTISGTARIFDRELGVISRPINSLVLPLGTADFTSVPIRTKSQYRLFQGTETTDPSTAGGILGCLKLQSNNSTAWEWSETSGILVSCASSGLLNGVESVVHAAWDGYVYLQENGETFNGTPINAVYQTPFLPFSDPSVRKILRKIAISSKATTTVTIMLGVSFDDADPSFAIPPTQNIVLSSGGTSWDSGTTWDESGIVWDIFTDSRSKLNLIGSGFTCSFIFTSSGGGDYSITNMTIQFSDGARR
jgi:hypothetical protein